MKADVSSPQPRPRSDQPGAMRPRYTGRVVYLYAFDVAYELSRQPLGHLLGQPVAPFRVDADKRIPRHHIFYHTQVARLPGLPRQGPHGPVSLERMVIVLPVGAISLRVWLPFAVDRLEELVAYHDLQFASGPLNDEVRQWAEEIRQALRPHCVRPVARLPEEEAYTVFCFEAPLLQPDGQPANTESWLQAHRREVAALLTQETDTGQLSRQESDESTGRFLSYYRNDLVVVDWDAALIVDEPADLEETLHVMELANVQLAELEAYDRMLDTALERSYRDLAERPLRGRAQVLRELKELRIDLARLDDELSNITKFFGDWHLARVYQAMAARFHLADWQRAIDEKLQTLDELYQLLQHEQTNRWMLILEATIVLLFIIDLVILILGLKGGG